MILTQIVVEIVVQMYIFEPKSEDMNTIRIQIGVQIDVKQAFLRKSADMNTIRIQIGV